ncbi:hypothetical protein [Saccharicrinis sp. 156]|uniref:hypothetical protein n=1 Tax=Saccharicrinis sp. 156 TaxID=3417574 RepID=UPI003D32CC9B
MKTNLLLLLVFILFLPIMSCKQEAEKPDIKILFLHHSTGNYIWHGQPPSLLRRVIRKISPSIDDKLSKKALLPSYFKSYNKNHKRNYSISEMDFPKASPYGWNNNPFDYYNIWVKNAGDKPFKKEPTLEILTKDYQVITFKHCFPVTNIREDLDSADINSSARTIANYKLQYLALRDKLHTFPKNKFILFTGAVQVESNLPEDQARRARKFFEWVRNEWDLENDNIYLWDLYSLETEGGLYLKEEYAVSKNDSHPNKEFSTRASKLLFNRIIDVIENNGETTALTGE